MNRYHCKLILPTGVEELTIECDSVNNDSSCSTTFTVRTQYINDFGTTSYKYEMVMQIPTERLIITSVDYNIIT